MPPLLLYDVPTNNDNENYYYLHSLLNFVSCAPGRIACELVVAAIKLCCIPPTTIPLLSRMIMNMKKNILLIAISLVSANTFAASDKSQLERLESAEERIRYLEQRVQDQNDTIATKQTKGESWADSVEVGGLIEVEAGFSDPENGDSTSDTTVATLELGFAANISDQLSAEVVFLHEEDDTDFEVDVAQFSYAIQDTNWSFVAGQTYVPFGVYETALVSSPLTVDLGETRETALMMSYEDDSISGAFYIFNGTNKDGGEDKINNWGTNFAYSNDVVSLGLGYINDLGDSGTVEGELGSNTVTGYTAGITASMVVNAGDFTIIAEQVSAESSFSDAPLAGEQPKARNFEVGYGLTLGSKPATIAVAFQSTDEASNLELPEDKTLVGWNVDISDNIGLGFELSKEEDYANNKSNSFVAQVAVSF